MSVIRPRLLLRSERTMAAYQAFEAVLAVRYAGPWRPYSASDRVRLARLRDTALAARDALEAFDEAR